MTADVVTADAAPAASAGLGRFERCLTLWVGLCFVTGIALDQ